VPKGARRAAPRGCGRSVAAVPRPLAAALAIASAVASLSAAAAAASWRAPVSGRVLRAYAYSPRAPFARGSRRGVDLAARAGERVVAPCSGLVVFRGRVPRFGAAVSIRCGALVATLLGVLAERAGRIRRGVAIGRATGPVHLGARRAAVRWGYVDPLALIGTDPPRSPPLGPPPAAAPRLQARPRPRTVAPSPAGMPGIPWPAWAGIGLLGSLLGPWAVSTSRRRSTTSTLRRTSATRTR
jgi:hypothetical protein